MASDDPPRALLIALLLIALNLRPPLAAVGPVLDLVRADLNLSFGQAGLLTTVPMLCMGAFALFAPRWLSHFGFRHGLGLATLLLGLSSVLRLAASFSVLLFSALLAGAAIAIIAPLLNAQIKLAFHSGTARITVWVTTALCAGAAVSAALSAPLSMRFGWPMALAGWSIPALLAAWLWWRVPITPMSFSRDDKQPMPWRTLRAWQLMLTFGLNTFVFFALLAWLAPAFQAFGCDADTAGHLLSVFALAQIVGTLSVSRNLQTDRRPVLCSCAVITVLALCGLWLAPMSAPFIWVAMAGGGGAGIFAMNMVQPLDYSNSPAKAGAWTAMMSSGGYFMAATGPWITGKMRDLTGNYDATFKLLCVVSTLTLLSTFFLTPRRHAL